MVYEYFLSSPIPIILLNKVLKSSVKKFWNFILKFSYACKYWPGKYDHCQYTLEKKAKKHEMN